MQVDAPGGSSSSFSLPPAVNDRMEALLSLPMAESMRADDYATVLQDIRECAELHAGMDRTAVLRVLAYPYSRSVDDRVGQEYYHFGGEPSHVWFAREYMRAVAQQPKQLSVTKIVFVNVAVPLDCTCMPLLAEVEMGAWPTQAAIRGLHAAGTLRHLSIRAVPTAPLQLSGLAGVTHLTLAALPDPDGSSLPPNLQELSGPIGGRLAVPGAWASTLAQTAAGLSWCSMQATLSAEGQVEELSAAGGAWEQVFVRLGATCHVELLYTKECTGIAMYRRTATCAASSGSIVMRRADDGGACTHTSFAVCLLAICELLPAGKTLTVDNTHGCHCTYTTLDGISMPMHVSVEDGNVDNVFHRLRSRRRRAHNTA